MAMERDFELIFKNEEGTVFVLYPSTVAKQILLGNGYTAEDHINSDLHLFGQEVSALSNFNTANGLLKLDENGFIPDNLVNESIYLVRKEFATISDMLTNGGTVISDTLVMVLDASEDPGVNGEWAIYRRNDNADFSTLDGWVKIAESESLDLDMSWEGLGGKPQSSVDAIDEMVSTAHVHPNLNVQTGFGEEDNHATYQGKKIAYDEEVLRVYASDYYDPDEAPGNSYWLRPLNSQSWWSNSSITDAGVSMYERFANNDEMEVTPKLLTHHVTTVNRMCYSCDNLKEVQQYDYFSCVDFASQFEDCRSLTSVPIMNSGSGQYFAKQFKGCVHLEQSPLMDLANATTVSEQYSGDVNLIRVLDFGSTGKVTNMVGWFNGCSALQLIQGEIDFTSITSDSMVVNMFNACIDLEKVSFKPGTLTVSLSLANTNLTPACLTAILEGLPEIGNDKSINISGIPATDTLDEDVIISTIQKGWNVITA